MGKPGGNNCCVPGCTNYYAKTILDVTKSVSYVSFPKVGVSAEQDEWRRGLICAVARADSNFNPSKHRICTVHFERNALLFHGKHWFDYINLQ